VTPKQALLSVGTLVLALVLPEVALRIAGFTFESGIEFGFPRPQKMVDFAPDEHLFWKLRAADDPAPKKYVGNSMGFPGGEVLVPKPADACRIVFLGDSCTFLGYPEQAIESLHREHPLEAKRYESVILAIPGYSSHQGLAATELYGQKLGADVVVVYFGWNDHWLAYGAIDSKKQVHVSSSAPARFLAAATHASRLLQAMNWLRMQMAGANDPIADVRVLPEEYANNLTEIDRLYREHGTTVVFVTAPTSFYALGVAPYLLLLHFVKDAESAIKLHREYNAIVRDVARRTGAVLLDLEAEAEKRDDLAKIFIADGIHFTPEGNAWLGERVAKCIAEHEPVRSLH
jgi:lysophospholipase L1-like esterase